MRLKKRSLTKHSVIMLFRNRKSYILLSFTIVLSFAVLLGFLVYTDTISYNRYKGVYGSPDNAIIVMEPTDPSSRKFSSFLSFAEKIDPEIEYYTYSVLHSRLTQYARLLYISAYIIPDGNPPIIVEDYVKDPANTRRYYNYIHPVNIVEGRGDISGNEAIINKSYFDLLSPEHELPFTLYIPVDFDGIGMDEVVGVEIVGVFEDSHEYDIAPYIDDEGVLRGAGTIFCNRSIFDDEMYGKITSGNNLRALISTNKPKEIAELARTNQMPFRSAAQMRQQANESMRNTSSTKMYVSMMLFVILGINLFGCFENALSERRFEIGVKRALGASNFDIIRQFLTESCLVLLVDILISIALISSLMVCYKLYMLLAHDYVLTIHISSYSAAMFGVCSLCMTLLFSALFAYRATRVEIVKYLKCE